MILPLLTISLVIFLYRKIIYYRIDPALSIIIIKNNNGYSLLTYSNRFTFDTYETLEELSKNLVIKHRVYYLIDQVDGYKVVDYLMRGLHLSSIEKMFHYHVYWENKELVLYMLRKNILLQFVTYPDFHILVTDKKWRCFDLVTSLMAEEFDTIFDKLHPDNYDCILELGRRLKKQHKLFYNPKIQNFLNEHNLEIMKQLQPFINNEILPLDVNKMIASYLLY